METVFDSLTDKDKERLFTGLQVTVKSFANVRHKDFKRFNLANGSSVLVKLDPYLSYKEHLSILITNPKSKHFVKEDFYFYSTATGRMSLFETKAKEMIKVISDLM